MNQEQLSERRAMLVSSIVVIVMFVAGAIVGRATSGAGLIASLPPSGPASSTELPSSIYDLDLTEEQRLAVDSILEETQPRLDSIVAASIDGLQATMRRVDGEVRALLMPEQVLAFDSIIESGPRIQAVRRTLSPRGLQVDTVR